jgi:hypothetical protein
MTEGTNRFNTGRPGTLSSLKTQTIVDIGSVVTVDDPQGLDRIKVVIKGSVSKGGDANVELNDLPWCIPMLPKYFTSKPKVGEAVYIFTFNDDKLGERLYMGPIISQPHKLNFDGRSTTALSAFNFGVYQPQVDYKRIPELLGVYPKDTDIAIQGRYNTDLIFKENEVLLRAGKITETKPTKKNPYPFTFNNKTQGFIQIKNDVEVAKKTDTEEAIKGTVTNIISNKINLITHKDGSPRFNVLNQEDLISDEEMSRILAEAHPLPFGDILIQYLKLLKNTILNHVHNGNGKKATDLTDGNAQFVAEFKKNAENLEKAMISKNVRVN